MSFGGMMRAEKMDVSEVGHGILLLTFDDSRSDDWIAQLPRFQKYNAHATFFFNGAIDAGKIKAIRTLRARGHSIGLHAFSHRNAVPAMEEIGADAYIAEQILPQISALNAAGIDVDSFAYPNNRRTEATDRALRPYFRRFRAGLPRNKVRSKGFRIADEDDAYLELEKLPETSVFGGVGIGEYYATTLENLNAALERAARENRVLTFFSHGIFPNADGVHMPEETLEFLLCRAAELEMKLVGFDEL